MLGKVTKNNLWLGLHDRKNCPLFAKISASKEMFYYFKIGNRYFITIDTQVYKLGLRRVLSLRTSVVRRNIILKSHLRNDKEAEKFRIRQNYWLHELFRSLPKSAPKENWTYCAILKVATCSMCHAYHFNIRKTIFMHTPLFIETPEEILAGIEEESLDIEVRFELLNLFDANHVDSGNVLYLHFWHTWPNHELKLN